MQKTWKIVREISLRLGNTEMNYLKWRYRGFVPLKWHVLIYKESKKKVTLEELAALKKPAKAKYGELKTRRYK